MDKRKIYRSTNDANKLNARANRGHCRNISDCIRGNSCCTFRLLFCMWSLLCGFVGICAAITEHKHNRTHAHTHRHIPVKWKITMKFSVLCHEFAAHQNIGKARQRLNRSKSRYICTTALIANNFYCFVQLNGTTKAIMNELEEFCSMHSLLAKLQSHRIIVAVSIYRAQAVIRSEFISVVKFSNFIQFLFCALSGKLCIASER